ncbi:hypothetical protein I6E17_02045 [Fusobacterium perfoetens]|uniref:hypothetical protein n=1 Tax=Fusobacterium perfoetens TaxID=852 RepID=UPI001F1D1536|nr:hypothetical protein [Fusobacterium perfoetens]MCF2624957.1 hypothetical protein [Fusobacterium perfoetens]
MKINKNEKEKRINTLIKFLGNWDIKFIEEMITFSYSSLFNENPVFPEYKKEIEMFVIDDKNFKFQSKSLTECYLTFYRWVLSEKIDKDFIVI